VAGVQTAFKQKSLSSGHSGHRPGFVRQPFLTYLGHHPECAIISLVHNGWRISLFEGEDIGELFDLNNDPIEMNNLWAEPNVAEKKFDMLYILALQQLKLRDRSLCATAQA